MVAGGGREGRVSAARRSAPRQAKDGDGPIVTGGGREERAIGHDHAAASQAGGSGAARGNGRSPWPAWPAACGSTGTGLP